MKQPTKRAVVNGSVIAIMFIAPLIIFAAVYYSGRRTNSFRQGSVAIAVKEGNQSSEELMKELNWAPQGDPVTSYQAEKPVQIKDERQYPGEAVRVCFVPLWYTKDESSSSECVSDTFSTDSIVLNGNQLVFTDSGSDHPARTITLNLHEGWSASGWEYRDDGYFYYTGPLHDNNLTAQLLDSVSLNPEAYVLTENAVFRLDVLADAVQISGDASSARDWQSPNE